MLLQCLQVTATTGGTSGVSLKGYIAAISEKLGSTHLDRKSVKIDLKTILNGIGKGSGGFVQPVASSSSNMSPWGLTSNPFRPTFFDFGTFSENQDRIFRISF